MESLQRYKENSKIINIYLLVDIVHISPRVLVPSQLFRFSCGIKMLFFQFNCCWDKELLIKPAYVILVDVCGFS